MKTLPLTHSQVALVDDQNYDRLAKYKWWIGSGGLVCRLEDKRIIFLHREIFNLKRGDKRQMVYINGDKLDNQQSNLQFRIKHEPRPQLPKYKPKPEPEPIKIWLQHCRRYYTPRTCEQYRSVLRVFLGFCDTFSTIEARDIEAYIDYLLELGKSPNTVNSHLEVLRSFFRYHSEHNAVQNVMVKIKDLHKVPLKQRFLVADEYQKVLAVCNPHERDIVRFIANTGLRLTELLNLKPESVSPDRTHLRILGKGRKERIVPLNDTAREIIARYPDLKITHCGRLWVWRTCQSLAERAGIPPFGLHAIRHFFCTALVKANVPLLKVSRILGHSAYSVTDKVYCHILPSDLFNATDCLTVNL